jgi:hypothetical protein
LGRRRLRDSRSDPRIGVGRFQDRLLLVPGALAEHAVEAKPDEQGDQGEDNDNGQFQVLFGLALNIVRLR